ncbi:hypothetical protein GGR52DRAFT_379670 [Hypoxylon sp. FL1284]|nr:hypothetical protein GGR52DRAFT_379670 [Hypoxylon sp. FL1284]
MLISQILLLIISSQSLLLVIGSHSGSGMGIPDDHVVLADCGWVSQAGYYQSYNEASPRHTAVIVGPNGGVGTRLENLNVWAYFPEDNTNFTAKLGPLGTEGDIAGTASDGQADFTCWQQSGRSFSADGLDCNQRYDCNRTALASHPVVSNPPPTDTSTSVVMINALAPAPTGPTTTESAQLLTPSPIPSLTQVTLPLAPSSDQSSAVLGSSLSLPLSTSSIKGMALPSSSRTSSLLSGSTASGTSTTSSTPDTGLNASSIVIISVSIGVPLLIIVIAGITSVVVRRYLTSKPAQATKSGDESPLEAAEERPSTPPTVEADGYPAGSELETPAPVFELDGKLLPVEIHGTPVGELEGTSRIKSFLKRTTRIWSH